VTANRKKERRAPFREIQALVNTARNSSIGFLKEEAESALRWGRLGEKDKGGKKETVANRFY